MIEKDFYRVTKLEVFHINHFSILNSLNKASILQKHQSNDDKACRMIGVSGSAINGVYKFLRFSKPRKIFQVEMKN